MSSTGNVEANKSTVPDATPSDNLPIPSEVESSPKQTEEAAVPKAEEGEKQVGEQPVASETEESTRLMPHTMPESAEELPVVPENNEPSTSAPAVTTETDQQQLQAQDQGEAQETQKSGEQGESQQVQEPAQTEPTPTSNDAALAVAAASTTTAQPSNPTQPSKDVPESDENRPSSPAALEPSPSNVTTPVGKEAEGTGPVLQLNLLLTSGSRHPFKIDGKYLQKRGVIVPDNDPYQMSVYTLKELVWKEWRSDWETRPSSPVSIRLISFGKMLEDKSYLSESKFNREAPNVVHMTVKPQEIVDEEDAKAAKTHQSRDDEGNRRSPSCRCVIL